MLAWGGNSKGQLGDDGGPAGEDTPVRVDLPPGRRALAVGAGPLASTAYAVMHKKS